MGVVSGKKACFVAMALAVYYERMNLRIRLRQTASFDRDTYAVCSVADFREYKQELMTDDW